MGKFQEYLETYISNTKTEQARKLAEGIKDPDEFADEAYKKGIKDSIIIHILVKHYGVSKYDALEMTIHGD